MRARDQKSLLQASYDLSWLLDAASHQPHWYEDALKISRRIVRRLEREVGEGDGE